MVDSYVLDINEKDEMSQLLASIFQRTLNHPFVERIQSGKNGINVLRIPKGYYGVVHSSGGDYNKLDTKEYVESVVDFLEEDAQMFGSSMIGLLNVIDARSTDRKLVEIVGNSLADAAMKGKRRIAVINGELAKLGPMINCDCNIAGTAIGIISKDNAQVGTWTIDHGKTIYAVFDSEDKPLFGNSDGVGTKLEIYVRKAMVLKKAGDPKWFVPLQMAAYDYLAMNWDDDARIGARVKVTSGVLERILDIPFGEISEFARKIGEENRVSVILQHEFAGGRLSGYRDGVPCYNLSGSSVATIDEETLKNLPIPQEGDDVIAVAGDSRSNGYTARRRMLERVDGIEWHETEHGKPFLDYLTRPSGLFYPDVNKLREKGLTTSFTHMSGGAHRHKGAGFYSKHGLYVKVDNLPKPHACEIECAENACDTIEDAYTNFAMGTEAYFTADPSNTRAVIEHFNLNGKKAVKVGRLEKKAGIIGMELKAYNGKWIDFTKKVA